MALSRQMNFILLVIVLALIPGIVYAEDADFNVRGQYPVVSAGDTITSGLHTIQYAGTLALVNRGKIPPLNNISVTLLADNITGVDDSTYAEWTRSSVHWTYPANFTVAGTREIDWTSDITTTVDLPVTFTRTLNQTIFSQDGYQQVTCQVTFYNLTDLYAIWGEVDNYQRDKVNITVLPGTFSTDLPHYVISSTTRQYQIGINKSEIILSHPYTYAIVLKVDRIDPAKTVQFKPKCGINLITNIALTPTGINRTVTVPPSLLPSYVHAASATTNDPISWDYWSHYQRSAILSENSSFSTGPTTPIALIGVFRNGMWYLDYSNAGTVSASFHFGKTGDTAIVGDWDGSGITHVGIYRPSTGNWYLDTTKTGVVNKSFHFGTTSDIAVAGDWDGNSISDIGVFRPSNGNWYLDTTKTGVVNKSFHFGTAGDIPVIGDWNNDGTTNVGVFRPANGNWYLDTTGTGAVNIMYHFGTAGDIPLAGDWNNDGVTDTGVFRPSNGNWYLSTTKTGTVDIMFHFGKSGDIPIVGDWDGNGITNVGVFRPTNGNWYLDTTKTGVVNKTFHFGTTGDTPVVGKWI